LIVSNTSPLRYLIAVGQADLLPKVFGQVLIPSGVLAELMHPAGRADVHHWLEKRPAWLTVRELQSMASLGLAVIGALGLLRESYRQEHISDPVRVLDEMRSIGFRVSQALYQEFWRQIESMMSELDP
jgi:predicted nucleic acid-binding protein